MRSHQISALHDMPSLDPCLSTALLITADCIVNFQLTIKGLLCRIYDMDESSPGNIARAGEDKAMLLSKISPL